MKKLFILIVCSVVSLAGFAQSANLDQVWARVEALTKAVFETKDANALKDLVSDRVSYGHSAGAIEDKATMIDKAVSNKTSYKDIVFEKVSADVEGNTAIIRHNFKATTVDNGTEAPINLAILQVWKKENGKWRIWARQAVRIVLKP